LSELHKSKLKAFKTANEEKGEAAGSDGEGDADKEDELDPVVLIQPVRVKTSDLIGNSVKSSFFSTEGLFSGQNAEAVKKVVNNGVLVELTQKGQTYVAPVNSVPELFTGLLFDDVTFSDSQPLVKHLADLELEVMEEFVDLTLGSTVAMIATYVVFTVVGSVMPEVFTVAKSKGVTLQQFGGFLGVVAVAMSFVLLTSMRKLVLGPFM